MKKAQGELFGLALLFVVLIIGVLIYAQFQAANPNRGVDAETETRYKALTQSTIRTLIDSSTGCYVNTGQDTLRNLIELCMQSAITQYREDFTVSCIGSPPMPACKMVLDSLNESLLSLFNETNTTYNSTLGPIPFLATIDTPAIDETLLSNITFTNLDDKSLLLRKRGSNEVYLNLSNYLREGYKRVPSGFIIVPTSAGDVRLELFLYYR